MVLRRKEILLNATTWMNLFYEISQSQEDKYYMISLIRGAWRSRLREIESRMVVTKAWVGGKWEFLFIEHIVSVLEAKTSGVE